MSVNWLSDVSRDDERRVGKKAAALGAVEGRDLDIPRGFVVSAQAFESYIRSSGLEEEIQRVLRQVDRSDRSSIQRAANQIRGEIMDGALSDETRDEIIEAYERINMSEEVRNAGDQAAELVGGQRETEFVAVRASPTGARIPGAYESTMNVNGKDTLIEAIKETWASLYSARALRMEEEIGEIHSMGVIVQRMVDPEVSGAVLNRHPYGEGTYLVEALWGMGTALSQGGSTPDLYLIDERGSVRRQEIANKGWKVERDPTSGKTLKQRVAGSDRDARCIDDNQLSKLADAASTIEEQWRGPVKIEFCIGRNKLHVLDIERAQEFRRTDSAGTEGDRSDPIVRGRGASPGAASGDINILYSDTDVDAVEPGDMIVSVDAAERFTPVLPEIAGFVSDEGGVTSNLAMLARRLGVPTIVGVGNATDMLSKGETITIDGSTGTVTAGSGQGQYEHETSGEETYATEDVQDAHLTGTKVKVVDAPHAAAEGVIIPDYTDRRRAREIARQHHPEPAWIRTEDAAEENLYPLIDEREADVAGKGSILRSYGAVMRIPNLVESGAAFLGLDASALQEDGGRDALHNTIEKVAAEGEGCETALLLDRPDPELIDAAVRHGIDTVAVPGDHVDDAKRAVAKAERRFMLDRLRDL